MSGSVRIRLACLALIAAAMASLAGCAVPLGPGFHLRRETVTVHYVDRPVDASVYYHLQVKARNTGNRPLDLLKIRAPRRLGPAPTGGPRTAGNFSRGALPVPLAPPLPRRRSRHISFGYMVLVRGPVIFLEPGDWFPAFLPPRGLFAKSLPRAGKMKIAIFVPRGDRALTSGRLRRVRNGKNGRSTGYVFRIRKRDFAPFLLIGHFDEQKARAGGRSVFFWTSAPLPPSCAQSVAEEAVATAGFYRARFGRLEERTGPLRVIEIPAKARGAAGEETIPDGVLFSGTPAEACRKPGRFYFNLARNLAATWFGWAVRPRPGAEAYLGRGLRDYAALLAEENREGRRRRRRQVSEWLAEYGRLSARVEPLPPANLGPDPTGDQRRLAGVQSALFFVALEDLVGARRVQSALRILVGSLDGAAAGREELRSTLERESGEDLYGFFNRWLNRAGIPAAFRHRYAARESASRPPAGAALPRSQEEK